jgi:hypothetical protein
MAQSIGISILQLFSTETSGREILCRRNILESIENCINTYGYVRQEEIITTWLDKDFHRIKE